MVCYQARLAEAAICLRCCGWLGGGKLGLPSLLRRCAGLCPAVSCVRVGRPAPLRAGLRRVDCSSLGRLGRACRGWASGVKLL